MILSNPCIFQVATGKVPQLPLEGASLHRRGACLLLGAALGFAGARRRVRAEAALTEEQKMAILQEGIGTFGQRNFGVR